MKTDVNVDGNLLLELCEQLDAPIVVVLGFNGNEVSVLPFTPFDERFQEIADKAALQVAEMCGFSEAVFEK